MIGLNKLDKEMRQILVDFVNEFRKEILMQVKCQIQNGNEHHGHRFSHLSEEKEIK